MQKKHKKNYKLFYDFLNFKYVYLFSFLYIFCVFTFTKVLAIMQRRSSIMQHANTTLLSGV